MRKVNRRVELAAWLWVLAGLIYLTAEAIAAIAFPRYSYTVAYISALGVPGDSPAAAVMNVGGFMLYGVAFAAAGITFASALAERSRRRIAFMALAVANGVGNVLVGVFHAGESPLHGLGAFLAIVGGNAAVIVAGGVMRRAGLPAAFCVATRVVGYLGFASVVALFFVAGRGTMVEGAIERGSVYTIIGWGIVTGTLLLVDLRRTGSRHRQSA